MPVAGEVVAGTSCAALMVARSSTICAELGMIDATVKSAPTTGKNTVRRIMRKKEDGPFGAKCAKNQFASRG